MIRVSDEEDGHGKSFLDRPEEFKEILRREHIAFAEEHNKLLVAQAVLNDQLQAMRAVQKAAEARLPESRRHIDDRLNALRAFVDELNRKRPQ